MARNNTKSKASATKPEPETKEQGKAPEEPSSATPTAGGAGANSAPPPTETDAVAPGAGEGTESKPQGEQSDPSPVADEDPAKADSPTEPREGDPVPVLKVTAKQDHRRRAGLSFGREPVTIRAGEITQEQFEAIMADPVLVASKDFE
ncbi:hypothetical protein AUC70_11745 [Methyloceanibacter stevinii]|uniref:Mu-like prophage FluMu N-terminal domain-containing protein n=1 Tax=Methyloceanibacter stevinii TaxID=1774970 RepID=A0A1E3VJS5_9HYPH|nr:hypothetical protein [Methyloceanibacter stevinii]ODR93531.1 hypothetical protein AUC70_11745 [Methyloceanibacter stevinii]